MYYDTGSHTVFYHRYHIVWITKYRYTMLKGKLGMRICEIIRQVCKKLGVKIIIGVISGNHVGYTVSVCIRRAFRPELGHFLADYKVRRHRYLNSGVTLCGDNRA